VIVLMPPPGFRRGRVRSNIDFLRQSFTRPRGLGRVVTESGGVIERGPDTVRGPDVSYWIADRLPFDQTPVGYPSAAPDLCEEILSPDDRHPRVMRKVSEYLSRGVRLVWVADPETRTVTVHRPDGSVRIAEESDTLSGEDMLPGFTAAVREFFA
jgi:Uma2 family endonuclease